MKNWQIIVFLASWTLAFLLIIGFTNTGSLRTAPVAASIPSPTDNVNLTPTSQPTIVPHPTAAPISVPTPSPNPTIVPHPTAARISEPTPSPNPTIVPHPIPMPSYKPAYPMPTYTIKPITPPPTIVKPANTGIPNPSHPPLPPPKIIKR